MPLAGFNRSRRGLLGPRTAMIVASLVIATLMSPSMTVRAMAIGGESLTATNSTSNYTRLYDMPNDIDEDDLLAEYGRFMVGNMNQSVDPCEDFYQYACGNWKKSELISEKLRNETFLHGIKEKIDEMMIAFLKNVTDDELKTSRTAEVKAKMFYKTCLEDVKQLEKGYKAVLESKEFAEDANAKDRNHTDDWVQVNFMSSYGIYPILPLAINYNSQSRKLEIYLPPLERVLASVDSKNMTKDFKIEDEKAQLKFKDELQEMIYFEGNLTSYQRRRNETEELTLSKFLLQHSGDKFNWTRYFEVGLKGRFAGDWVVHSSHDEIAPLVRFLNKTRLDTLRTYVKWRTLVKFYGLWKQEVGDKTVENNCREHTESYFNYALLPWFIETVYDADRRADILQVAKHVKDTFYELIDRYTWLDDETKSHAKTKLKAMDVQVGYTDEMRHRAVIDAIYEDVNMTADNWFKNLLNVEANRARVRIVSVNRALIPPLMTTRQVNAFYADYLNRAFITIGISQLPFYHIKFPPSMKFGGIGNIIGHEMAHGFDSYCYQFNYDGKKQNWWSEASLRNFRERYRCLESQYNKFIYRGVPTNGTLTSGDNIADNVGTRMSYYAYMKAYGHADGDRRPLPGVKFTNRQLYFLKFAQTWCSGKDDSTTIRRMKTDAHAYEEFRVVGTLGNMPEFSEVFKCKLGSDMNPLKKCVVW